MSNIINEQLFALSQDKDMTADVRYAHIEAYQESFEALIQAVIDGSQHLVLMGSAGQGKTQTVTDLLEASNKKCAVIKGSASPIGVYKFLFDNRDADVVVIDDSDSLYSGNGAVEAANILKAACDSKEVRKVSWQKQGSNLEALGLPNSFEATCQVIIITNEDLVYSGTGRQLKVHRVMEPVVDRAVTFKTGMPNREWEVDYFRMMNDKDSLLVFKEEGMTAEQQDEIMNFVFDNAQSWKQMTFRMLGKICRFYKTNQKNWQSMSLLTL